MKTKTILTLIAAGFCLIAASSTAYAQTKETNRDENGKIVKGPYLTATMAEGWFIEIGAGPSIYLGGLEGNVGENIGATIDLSVGKWLTPAIGARINANYTPKYREWYNGQELHFYYWSVHADLLWDMLTSFGGYKWNRVYHLIPFVGAGYSQNGAFNYFPSVGHEFTLHGGLINKFRLCNWLDFNLEIRATAANHYFDRIDESGTTTIDVPFSVAGGFTFNLGKHNYRRADSYANEKVAAATAAKDAQLAALAAAKAKSDAAAAALAEENAALKAAKPDTVVITKGIAVELPEVIMYFSLGKSKLTPQEASHFETFVYYVKYTVASGKKVTLVGSCDKQTGSAKYNEKLSKKRAEEVKDMLVKDYGIPADMIETVGAGGSNNRFKIQEMNRCVYVRFQP